MVVELAINVWQDIITSHCVNNVTAIQARLFRAFALPVRAFVGAKRIIPD